jgi:serine/threonine protein phosphatase PrpC
MMGRQRRLPWLWGGASRVGGRAEQQDRWGVFMTPDRDGLFAVVADGLGGHRDGALGAQAVMDAAEIFFQERFAYFYKQPSEALTLLCEQVQTAVANKSRQAHSTIVALWLHQDHAHWMHVGDSRLYHLRKGRRLLRTRDHSAAQMLLELGEISEAEVATHPAQSCLYRSLGSEETPRPDIGSERVQGDDMFVLCSDGIWEQIHEETLWKTAVVNNQLSKAAVNLAEMATSRGGPEADNATLVIVRPVKSLGIFGVDWFYKKSCC